MAWYKDGKGKDKTGKATYKGPGLFGTKGSWYGPIGNEIPGPQRKYGDRNDRYYYSAGKVRKKYQGGVS